MTRLVIRTRSGQQSELQIATNVLTPITQPDFEAHIHPPPGARPSRAQRLAEDATARLTTAAVAPTEKRRRGRPRGSGSAPSRRTFWLDRKEKERPDDAYVDLADDMDFDDADAPRQPLGRPIEYQACVGGSTLVPSLPPATLPARPAPAITTPAWYDEGAVSAFERESLPLWFSTGTMHDELYVSCRNFTVHTWRRSPASWLTLTALRRALACDVARVMELHAFLIRHGLINAGCAPETRPVNINLRTAPPLAGAARLRAGAAGVLSARTAGDGEVVTSVAPVQAPPPPLQALVVDTTEAPEEECSCGKMADVYSEGAFRCSTCTNGTGIPLSRPVSLPTPDFVAAAAAASTWQKLAETVGSAPYILAQTLLRVQFWFDDLSLFPASPSRRHVGTVLRTSPSAFVALARALVASRRDTYASSSEIYLAEVTVACMTLTAARKAALLRSMAAREEARAVALLGDSIRLRETTKLQ